MIFPSLSTHDLEGRSLRVPEDLPGPLNLIMLAFQRAHSAPLESWHGPLQRLRRTRPELEFWEVPVLSSSYRIWRPFIDNGMKAGTPDPAARRRTLTVYTSLEALARELSLDGFDTIALFLLDAQGRILWRGAGGFTPALYDSLRVAVESAGGAREESAS